MEEKETTQHLLRGNAKLKIKKSLAIAFGGGKGIWEFILPKNVCFWLNELQCDMD